LFPGGSWCGFGRELDLQSLDEGMMKAALVKNTHLSTLLTYGLVLITWILMGPAAMAADSGKGDALSEVAGPSSSGGGDNDAVEWLTLATHLHAWLVYAKPSPAPGLNTKELKALIEEIAQSLHGDRPSMLIFDESKKKDGFGAPKQALWDRESRTIKITRSHWLRSKRTSLLSTSSSRWNFLAFLATAIDTTLFCAFGLTCPRSRRYRMELCF
jgi:hypothetical protein